MYPYDKPKCEHAKLKYYNETNHVVCQECGKVFPETQVIEKPVDRPYPVIYEQKELKFKPPYETYC